MRRTKSTECEGVSCSQEAKVSISRGVGSRPRKGCARTSKGVGDVSAVGTRIGRRTSSRRATSDAGGARLSEAGESDQLTERGREKEKHEFHEHRAFFATFSFSFFFFFFFRDIRFDNRTSFPSYFPIIILLYFLRRACRGFNSKNSDASSSRSRWKKPLKKQRKMDGKEISSHLTDCCPAF
ncbi:uncharacterized protein LOC726230 isoform X2 [Apis mellifera]|uniref:Uncharacterized protein LOC726230 isoform X2 n=1 Tax=Apis mellifera TaxID=7460 RepID=A0A7M7KZF5_APIME|nr:uncharacterized protein LOC726230 isoform X2 [Apis mellifera]|eukprot:XP_026294992.1 uncharacterized protein LOC726230 isoform X2 [Apis mellifera]